MDWRPARRNLHRGEQLPDAGRAVRGAMRRRSVSGQRSKERAIESLKRVPPLRDEEAPERLCARCVTRA